MADSPDGPAKVWRITPYMPSSKHFSLAESLTPEDISRITGATPKPSKDGKCKFQWEFFAEKYFDREDGGLVAIALPCAIWDYKGARWSAYGPAEVFRELGLLPPAKTKASA